MKIMLNAVNSYGFFDEKMEKCYLVNSYNEKEARYIFDHWIKSSGRIPDSNTYECVFFDKRIQVPDSTEIICLSRQYAPVVILSDGLENYDNADFPFMLRYVVRRLEDDEPICLYAKAGYLNELVIDSSPVPVTTDEDMMELYQRQQGFSDEFLKPIINEMTHRFLQLAGEPTNFIPLYAGSTG